MVFELAATKTKTGNIGGSNNAAGTVFLKPNLGRDVLVCRSALLINFSCREHTA